jgi:anaerobic magnesium-protoporphyrin IX monomethyl ester cyclase
MLSILVCHSYFLQLDQKQTARAKPYPPLATLQVVSMLRTAGHHVVFFDAMLAQRIGQYDSLLATHHPDLVLFYEDNFNFLSKMCLGAMRDAACQMISAADRAGARVIASGPDVTDAPAPYLRAGANFALIGEGLTTLMELLPRLQASPRAADLDLVRGLPGIATLSQGLIATSSAHRSAPIAKEVGLAAWDLVDIEKYRSVWLAAHGYFSLNMAASRGCPFRCAWCAKPIWGNQYVQREASDVAAEMAYLRRAFNPDHIWFADDIFGFRVDWVRAFADAVRAADGGIPFTIQTRADLITVRMAEALRDAGCREAWIGAESGSQRVLDAMNKGTTVQEILIARDRLRAVGIKVGFFIQLGYMDEQLADILATRELLQNAQPDEIGVSVAYPLPGTKFYDLVKAQMRGKTRWTESSDLEMMFQGTYTSEFYRSIRNLLHDQVSLQATAERSGLDSRWNELLSREMHYRTPADVASA